MCQKSAVTLAQMGSIVYGVASRPLRYRDLTEDNGLANGAWP